eukprot:scaffold4212_cov122-Isochrysis_galbana.AAC.5
MENYSIEIQQLPAHPKGLPTTSTSNTYITTSHTEGLEPIIGLPTSRLHVVFATNAKSLSSKCWAVMAIRAKILAATRRLVLVVVGFGLLAWRDETSK